ncbi:MAG: DUF1822 family protein [Nostoc sp. DedVER02]|uniref:DUF1822 family protein n=1 Tax=unclassified Nostoc TaxID=2593658 RepID=UPI002AD23E10|nr:MULTISPECIES: DUF1822 family protein [unclassified Nostoc]MDZ7987967.1 DUF1822 family protein [Nostoc sp. DedVER02]MDZ8114891.1 DUF1822 family protein [Nostoc sp. DedVER01b]
MTNTQPHTLSVPLPKNAHRWAEEFAAQQDNPEKGKQVYLNTLAVYAVHSYLKWLNVETALNQGDSWHRALRAIFDVADLVLPGVGKLECRPVLPGEATIVLPPTMTQERIGYVGVQFSQQLDSVELLGFLPAREMTESSAILQIAQLQSFDSLFEIIYRRTLLINLRQWVTGIFETDWQSPELVFANNFRSNSTIIRSSPNSISRAKVINLKSQVLLLLQLTSTDSEVFDIRLRVYPGDDSIHLPPNLQMIVLDEAGNTGMEVQARSADDWMQLEFSCQHEEKFSVKIVLGETSLTEEFVV